MISRLRFLILATLILSVMGCFGCGSNSEPGARIRFEVEFQPDKRRFSEYHADILVDGSIVATVENGDYETVWVEAGEYTVRAEREGFEPDEKRVRVAKKGSQSLHFVLEER